MYRRKSFQIVITSSFCCFVLYIRFVRVSRGPLIRFFEYILVVFISPTMKSQEVDVAHGEREKLLERKLNVQVRKLIYHVSWT